MITREEMNQAKSENIQLTIEELTKLPQKKLYQLAKSFGIRSFSTPNGAVYSSKVTRKTKPYLVTALWEDLEDFRASQRAKGNQAIQSREGVNYDFRDLVSKVFADFHKACQMFIGSQDENRGTNLAVTCAGLGGRLASGIKQIPHYRTGESRSDYAHLSDFDESFKILDELISKDDLLSETMRKALPYLKQGAKSVFHGSYQFKKEARAKREQEILQADEVEVEVAPYLEWAKGILENIGGDNPRGYWQSVSIALAIATGRRMNELHFDETKVEKINDHWVWFTGQSKGKTYSKEFFEKYPAFAIPTLVKADLVVKGFQFLHEQGKVVSGDRRKVNKRFSSDLGKRFKRIKAEVGIPSEITFHENRDLYVQCALKLSAIPQVFETIANANKREADYACYLLGEGRAVYGGRYQLQKNLAFLSYQDKYLVADLEALSP